MKKGDRIRVKNGTNDPDFNGRDLSGYIGHVEDIYDDNFICILWDESTLENFDDKFIRKCDRKNLDHTRMVLTSDEVEVIEQQL
jgi:hypothetical protein